MKITYSSAYRIEDIDQLVVLHKKSFPDFFLSSVGPRFLNEFYRAFLEDPTAIVIIAYQDEIPIGVVVGTLKPAGFYTRMFKRRWIHLALAAILEVSIRPRKLIRLVQNVLSSGSTPPEIADRAYLASLCVSPNFQGQGVGQILVKEWSTEVSSRKVTGAFLTTDANDNEAINNFYVNLMWSLRGRSEQSNGRPMNYYTYDFKE